MYKIFELEPYIGDNITDDPTKPANSVNKWNLVEPKTNKKTARRKVLGQYITFGDARDALEDAKRIDSGLKNRDYTILKMI